jgi:spore maturation protein CgeB
VAKNTVRSSRMSVERQSVKIKGWSDGFSRGKADGYYLGRCEAVLQQIKPSPLGWWNIKVLFITSGKGFPYSPLDQSVIDALRPLVRELIVITPTEDFVTTARKMRPDYALVLEGLSVETARITQLRQEGIRTAIWLTDDPYYTDYSVKLASHYDYVFTLELECVSFYKQNGCIEVHYLPFGANVSIFRPKRISIQYQKDVSFIGSAYWNRVEVIDQIAPYLATKNVHISGLWWNRLRHFHTLSSKIELNKWMEAEETSCYYYGSKIVINLHRAIDDMTYNQNSRYINALSPNPRTFEIGGCGTLQLTDVRSDLPRFYTPDVEIVTYNSANELREKIDYYLRHEEERRAIALNALKRTVQEHTYGHRLAQMLRVVFG